MTSKQRTLMLIKRTVLTRFLLPALVRRALIASATSMVMELMALIGPVTSFSPAVVKEGTFGLQTPGQVGFSIRSPPLTLHP